MARKCMTKSNRPVKRRITFVMEDQPGLKAAVAGSFNGWIPEKALEDKKGDGVYTATLMLSPGTYQYKFVVNGDWKIDERNPNFTPNELGCLNSVLVVEEK